MKTAILMLTILLAVGCAGTRIRPVEIVGPADAAALHAALLKYDRAGEGFRVLGEVRHQRGPRIGFGARAVAGRAVRMDAVASPSTKLLFSAGCPERSGCEVFFPDDFVVYREERPVLGGWLSLLVTGRVPLLGEPVSAGIDAAGSPVLRFSDRLGQWAEVVFSPDGRLPLRALYGEADGRPRLELVYLDFRRDGELDYPGEVVVGGEDEGEEFLLRIDRIEPTGEIPEEVFRLRTPEGARVIETDGSTTWKKLGMYWTPRN